MPVKLRYAEEHSKESLLPRPAVEKSQQERKEPLKGTGVKMLEEPQTPWLVEQKKQLEPERPEVGGAHRPSTRYRPKDKL